MSSKFLSRFVRLLAALAILAIAVTLGVVGALRGSLARLDGTQRLAGLAADVSVERDGFGVPTIQASNRLDAVRALGFVHAQERFFQMDLLRRAGAGELSALLGESLVGTDRFLRRHQLRDSSRASLAAMPSAHRALLDAYTAGVNAGLQALRVRPPEYLLLRSAPEPWLPEDSLLVGGAMFFSLQEPEGNDDLRRDVIRKALPPAAARFFFPASTEWDAPIDQTQLPLPPVPPPEVLDFRGDPFPQASVVPGETVEPDSEFFPGSNSWGVHGAASTTGSAILSNDMHLDHGVPNIWFRARLLWTDPDGRARQLVGVTLPGIPVLVVGSNGDIAWGFTNATLDTTDVADLELNPANPGQYRTPQGWRDFEQVQEVIRVRGGTNRSFRFEKTVWGPVIGGTGKTPKRALLWIPHRPGALGLGLADLNDARSVADALRVAPESGNPVQNLLVGDRRGNLAWTLIGRLPKRVGFDGRLPVSFADGSRRWGGWLEASEYPRFEAPAGGRLWTANNRIAGSPEYLRLGSEDTDLGARARQIRDHLLSLPAPVSEKGLLGIHRDDRALFLARWQELLLRTLAKPEPGSDAARWAELAHHVRNWGGRAATNSVGYRVVRGFRLHVLRRLYEPVVRRCRDASDDPNRGFDTDRHEHAAWTLLEQRPGHLLNTRFQDYPALLGHAVNAVLADFDRSKLAITNATWGARNELRVQHPLAKAVPQLSAWLDLPPIQLPGDSHMPRVQGATFGASERIVVSPGHEEAGYFHMPGGQSGHFLSPYFRKGYEAWLTVQPSPLLPGPTEHRLVLAK